MRSLVSRDQHAAIKRHARSRLDQASQNETECKHQGDAVVGASEANQGVRCEREGNQAARHFEVGVEKRVRHVRRISKDPDEDQVTAYCNRPKKDEPKSMDDAPNLARNSHKSPKTPHTCP